MPKVRQHGDGALYKIRGGKLYRGVIDLGYTPDGKRDQRYVHARTQRECRDKLDALKAELAKSGGRRVDKSVTLADWMERWLDEWARPNVDPNTYKGYRGVTRNWIIPTIGRKKKLTDVLPSDVQAVRRAILKADRSTSLARQSHIALNLAFKAALAERLIEENPAEHVTAVAQRNKTSREAIPTASTIAILKAASALPGGAGARWWFKLLAGARQGEILGATLDDLDLDAGVYRIRWKLEALVRTHGCLDDAGAPMCGKKQGARCPQAVWLHSDDFEGNQIEGQWWLTRPKSHDEEMDGRYIPLIPQLVAAMRVWLDATKDWPNPHGLIWRREDGSPIRPDEDAQEWRDLLVSAGVIRPDEAVPGGTRFVGHTARHTTVSILGSLGVDDRVIGEITGHTTAQVISIYRHVQSAERRAAMEALGNAWGEALQIEA